MNDKDEKLSRRFYRLNVYVAAVILVVIAVAVSQFGEGVWQKQKYLGFIIDGERTEAGWNEAQCRGIAGACHQMGYNLLLRDKTSAQDTAATVAELVAKGAKVIFILTTPADHELKDIVSGYPSVMFYSQNRSVNLPNLSVFEAQLAESEFLAGMLSGLNTKTGKVGYIASDSSPYVNQYINSFAMGVQKTNPQAEVILMRIGVRGVRQEEQAVMNMRAERVDTLSYFDNGSIAADMAQYMGIDFISCYVGYPEHSHYLGYIDVNWREFYAELLRSYGKHYGKSGHIARYYPLVDFILSSSVTARQRSIIETARYQAKRKRPVFAGEIVDRRGIKRSEEGEAIGSDTLERMDWLVRGVRSVGN